MPFTPRRRRGVEILDAPEVSAEIRERSHRDIWLANVVFGGHRALRFALRDAIPALPPRCVVLDVGAGAGAGTRMIQRYFAAAGLSATVIPLDIDAALAKASPQPALCGSITQLPVSNASIDLVVCSLLLHHFEAPHLGAALAELNRVARSRVIVADLRRSWIAAVGIWLCSFLLRFHPVSRHDGVVSVLRGFTRPELQHLIVTHTGAHAHVVRRLGFRLVASWIPTRSPTAPPSTTDS